VLLLLSVMSLQSGVVVVVKSLQSGGSLVLLLLSVNSLQSGVVVVVKSLQSGVVVGEESVVVLLLLW